MRIGLGYDIHRLESGRPLIIGGVAIPFDKGPVGHSDGDVLAHAIIDALLGAAALGNIGQFFPDTDPAYKNADSIGLLSEVVERIRRDGYEIVNVDANVILERPKLNPHLPKIRQRLSDCLGLTVNHVSVKPRTNEGVGPEGRGESIACHAVVLLEES